MLTLWGTPLAWPVSEAHANTPNGLADGSPWSPCIKTVLLVISFFVFRGCLCVARWKQWRAEAIVSGSECLDVLGDTWGHPKALCYLFGSGARAFSSRVSWMCSLWQALLESSTHAWPSSREMRGKCLNPAVQLSPKMSKPSDPSMENSWRQGVRINETWSNSYKE